ncbi:MAG: MATE family efflux transporter [Synergistaceae bacterium]|nr:MATE family efflux transporter [Synergistaceae bacterium]
MLRIFGNVKDLDEKYIRMVETPVERLILRMAIPTISIMLISALYNMADTYFVGWIGTRATAAVGVSFPLMMLIQAMGFFFGHGSGNYISRQMGAQNWDVAAAMAATGFISALICGATLMISGLVFLDTFARFFGATEEILPYTCDYVFYIFIGAPWMLGSLALNNMLRFQGSANYGMIGMISGAVLNIALDPLFIFVFNMGVSGAALATIISQFVSCCLLLVGCSCKGNIRINPRKFSPQFKFYKEIVRGGLPSLFRQGFASIATICLNHAAGSYGVAVIAAISIVQRVTIIANYALLGLGQGFQPVCGFNYGAERYDRVIKGFWFCVKVSFVIMLFLSVAGFFLASQIVALFRRDDAEVILVGALALQLQCIPFPLMSWVIPNNMMLQTIGKAFEASLLAFARQGLFLLPALFILTPYLGVFGIQLCQPIADFATFLLSIPLGLRVLKEMKENKSA